jgi:hypothetical protein
MVARRGEQLLQEYDATRAYGAYNRLRDESRVKVAELLQREGVDAQGAQQEYDEWHKSAFSRVLKDNLTSGQQRDIYQRLSDQRRQGDLDQLAHHEAQQHSAYKKQVIEGMAATIDRDIQAIAFDDGKVDGMIADHFMALDGLYPGRDLTAEKTVRLERFRTTQAQEIIDKNPKYAAAWLEEKKPELGDKYYQLKKLLESKAADNKLSLAYDTLYTRFGSNHEAAMSWLAKPDNQTALGLDFKEVNQLHSRFSQLLADRERIERIGRDNLEQQQKANSAAVLQSLYNPAAPKLDVHKLHAERKIDNATYEHAIKARESTVVDNPWTISELHDQVERGQDITEQLRTAVEAGQLSGKTAASLGKHAVDEKSKRAMQYIDRALRPSEADKWSPDKHLKYADATRLYYAKIAGGTDYEQAAYEVVKGYIDNVRRTVKMLPTPEGLTSEQKTDLTALEQAKQATAEKFRSGRLTPDVYREQMNALDNLIKIAVEQQQAGEMDAELEAIRKKKVQK